ncbi:MAG: DUF6291 domain-containing protein [Ruthenibacterium sp.]
MQESTDKSKYIPLYYSYLGQLSLLTDEQVGLLVIALLRYGRDGVEPDFPKDGSLFMAFSFIAENSNRAVERSLDGRTRGGKKRAENAQKDEKGRFLSAESSSNPAQTSSNQLVQQPSYNNINNNINNNNNNNINRRPRAGARTTDRSDDGHSKSNEDILAFCREVVGTMSKAQERIIMDAAAGMSSELVSDAIAIAYEQGAETPEYIAKTILTQRDKPDRRPGKI